MPKFFPSSTSLANIDLQVFKRNSVDDKGLHLLGSVHYDDEPGPPGMDNAFWDGKVRNHQSFFSPHPHRNGLLPLRGHLIHLGWECTLQNSGIVLE